MGIEFSDEQTPAPDGMPPQAASAGAAGAPPSNTAPANSIGCGASGGTKVVGSGIDSLYVLVPGSLKESAQGMLERLKQNAQSRDPDLRALAQYPCGDWILEVSDKGARMFSYVLTDSRFRIELARSSASSLPLAHVQISSAALAYFGVAQCIKDLLTILGHLGDVYAPPTVSRADLFVDVVTDADLSHLEDEHWVTRAHGKARYADQGRRSGYTVGRGGDISLRLYDKLLEIGKSGKDHAKRQWQARGWGGQATVWRVEAQVRRNALKEFDIRTVEDLVQRSGALWRYVILDWCRLVIPNPADNTPSRWPTHPFWTAIVDVPDFQATSPVGRRRLKRASAPPDWIIGRDFLSALTSFMAVYEIFDTAWALQDLADMVTLHFEGLESQGEPSLAGFISQRVALKTRTYGIGPAFKVPHEIPLLLDRKPRQRGFGDDDLPF